jgi:hypothetical protein
VLKTGQTTTKWHGNSTIMDNAFDAQLTVCSYNSDFSQNQLSFMQILNMA